MFASVYRYKRTTLLLAGILVAVGLFMFKFLGTEFLPELDEGAIYIRATCPLSVSLDDSKEIANKMRRIIRQFPRSKTGNVANRGAPMMVRTATGFYNV